MKSILVTIVAVSYCAGRCSPGVALAQTTNWMDELS